MYIETIIIDYEAVFQHLHRETDKKKTRPGWARIEPETSRVQILSITG